VPSSAIVHLYNAVSPLWRKIVFGMIDEARDPAIAIDGRQSAARSGGEYPADRLALRIFARNLLHRRTRFQPRCCAAVMDVLKPTPDHPIIFNLPATVEARRPTSMPTRSKYFCRMIPNRDSAVISLHTHNDRGTGVAAAELGLMAGGDRVEGCLFGNGERTGNCCLVTVALNMYTQGVDPELDFSDIDEVIKTVEYCNQLPSTRAIPMAANWCSPRFPAAIRTRSRRASPRRKAERRAVVGALSADRSGRPGPQLRSGDPRQFAVRQGRLRLGSGTGPGPEAAQEDAGALLRHVQELADEGRPRTAGDDIWDVFQRTYKLNTPQHFQLVDYEETKAADGTRVFAGKIERRRQDEQSVSGRGNGLISSVVATLRVTALACSLRCKDYTEHAMTAMGRTRAPRPMSNASAQRWQDHLGRGHRRRYRHRQRARGAQRGQ
jgi:2-isopropylmalate synthase